MLYGKLVDARTQATTVAELLKEKEIILGPDDDVSPAPETPISEGMAIAVYRNGTYCGFSHLGQCLKSIYQYKEAYP